MENKSLEKAEKAKDAAWDAYWEARKEYEGTVNKYLV